MGWCSIGQMIRRIDFLIFLSSIDVTPLLKGETFIKRKRFGIISVSVPKNGNYRSWYNLVLAIDEPLAGLTFDDVMRVKETNDYDLIEEAVGLAKDEFVKQVIGFIEAVAANHKKLLVHVHQYEGSTTLMAILREAGYDTISDGTNYD